MEQRLSFITLGVADLDRARSFYERLGWTAARAGQGLGIVFFQLGGLVLALYPRHELAKDADAPENPAGGFSGVTLAYNARSREDAVTVMAEALAAGAKAAAGGVLGRLLGLFRRPRRPPLGSRPQPPRQAGGGRLHPDLNPNLNYLGSGGVISK